MKDQNDSIVDKIWKIFSSMKLGLALLGLIALVAGIGTVFPQTDVEPDKAQAVGQIWNTLGFTHLYSTIWFRFLLGLLCINLIICSLQRFRGIYNRTFALRPPASVAAVPKKIQAKWNGESDLLRQTVGDLLKHKKFKLITTENNSNWGFIAIKRRLGNWGSMLSHIAFVVLVIGALLGSTLGFKGYFMTSAGSTLPLHSIQVSRGVVKQDFSIHVNSAEDRFLANGERDNWYTDMSILENGQEVLRQTISVNHPLSYKGVTFYQADFAAGVQLTADLKGQKIPVALEDRGGNYFQAPGTDLYLIAAQITSNSTKPILVFQVYKGTAEQPVQTGQLNTGQTIDVQGQYKLTLEGAAGFTGIQVKQDPGVMVIWLGCALLLGGLMLSFYWRPMVVSGFIESEAGSLGKLTMGATAGKVSGGVQEDFNRLIQGLNETNGITCQITKEKEA